MTDKAAIRAEANRLQEAFARRGAEPFEAPVLIEAGALLDLYGEDIRARAFVTHDPSLGEMMLRPDFTLPLVRRHLSEGRGAARYTYSGEVFRRQEDDPDRPYEYLQTGFEIIGEADEAATDAEVFAAFSDLLQPLGLTAAIGDLSLLRAAIEGLSTSEARKAALLHHLWRPRRFRRLIERYAEGSGGAGLQAVLDAGAMMAGGAPEIGLRSREEVEARIEALRAEAEVPPIPRAEVDAVEAIMDLSGPAPQVADALDAIAGDMPAVAEAAALFRARLAAIAGHGIDIGALSFEGSFGRTTLEYYDGFVFGFFGAGDLPPVATGGRYDALTRAVGENGGVPAVGGVIRPGLTLRLAR